MAQSKRLDLLKRQNAGQRLLPELKSTLASVLTVSSTNLNFLSLEESDRVRARVAQSFPPRDEVERRNTGYPFLHKRVMGAEMAKPLLPETRTHVFLILPEADRVGVLRLPAATVNSKWREILSAKPDGFIVVDTTFSNKTVVQVEKDEASEREIFDFAAWGTKWSDALSDFLA